MIYHGIDLVEVGRIREAVEQWGERFTQRVFTPGELEDCGLATRAPRFDSLAARWAAKEATVKALGRGLSGLGAAEATVPLLHLHEIEVRRADDGRPLLVLHGAAAEAAAALGLAELSLSLTHTREYAMASVIGLAGLP